MMWSRSYFAKSSPASSAGGPLQSLRLMGVLFLAAFLLYGVGAAMLPGGLGLALVIANAVAVVVIGMIALAWLRDDRPAIGILYATGRVMEAVCLAVGALLAVAGNEDANDTLYQWAMLALSVASIPFFVALRETERLPGWLAWWGIAGYAIFALGCVLVLIGGGGEVGLWLAIPGGLFEVVFAGWLILRGGDAARRPAMAQETMTA